MSKRKRKIAVIGAGMFGYPMADYMGELGHDVLLYDNDAEVIESLRKNRKHTKHFQDLELNNNVNPVSELEEAVNNVDIVVTAVPSQRMRSAAKELRKYLNSKVTILNLGKGLELDSNKRMSEVLEEGLEGCDYKHRFAVLSGGMIAAEFAKGKPMYATIASKDERIAKGLKNSFLSRRLILDTTDDVMGVELAGPLKNVLAITVGIGYGMDYEACTIGGFKGDFSQELIELAIRLGAKEETFYKKHVWRSDEYGSCAGDSRNKAFGIEIGKGATVEEALEKMKRENKTIEGYPTTKVLYEISKNLKVNVPLITEAYNVLYESKHAKKAIFDLMNLADRN